MTPEVTVKISFDAEGTASATSAAVSSSATAPPPMALDALDVAASSGAPSPRDPAELMSTQGSAATDGAPPPMALEQLVSAGSSAAPAPQPFGGLQSADGPPAPQALADLGIATGGDLPTPLEPDDLERQSEPAPGRQGKRGAARNG